MRRLLTTFTLLLGLGAFVVFAGGASDEDSGAKKFWVELDNAFGLIEGGDLKVAGVRAGKITEMKIDRATNRALVGIEVTQTGFGSLRTDTTCSARPQSLIGEYFIDCLPGTAPQELKQDAKIPVERTSSTIAPDLVNNVLRRPYRERFSIILNELGAAVAGNAENLNDAVRRAVPALRETNKVLAILGRQNKILGDLVRDGDEVIGDLTENRKDVTRWVDEARDTAQASAERRQELAEGFRKLPRFLAELQPAMAALGRVASEQTPALRDLNVSADQLERLFGNLEPFAEASRPAFKALGEASEQGAQAVRKLPETVAELNRFTKGAPELGKNLAIVLEHLDDRSFAVEKDPRSPGGQGYTGLEALLSYVYDQTLSTNVFDHNVHYLKVAVFESDCANYADIEKIKSTPGLEEQCGARVGPNAIGINFPDPTKKAVARRRAQQQTDRNQMPVAPQPTAPAAPQQGKQLLPNTPKLDLPPLLPGLPDLPPIELPTLPKLGNGDGPLDRIKPLGTNRNASTESQNRLLDYLLGG